MGEAIVLDMAAAVPLTTNSVTNSLTELSILIINNENKSLKHLCSKIHKRKTSKVIIKWKVNQLFNYFFRILLIFYVVFIDWSILAPTLWIKGF